MARQADLKDLKINVGTIVNNQWQVIKKIGEGGFGLVFECKNIRNPNQRAALKAEPLAVFKDDEVLKMEAYVLKCHSKATHSCKLYATGKTTKYNFIVMTLLGKSVSELRRAMPEQKFSMGTVIHIGLEALEAIMELHAAGFLHRDIKPSNFALPRRKGSKSIYIFDFGLARQYIVKVNGVEKLRDPRKTVPFKGTVRYCSLNVHRLEEYGRHDDLWSLLYMLVELCTGSLPWKGMDRKNAEEKKETGDEEFRRLAPREFWPIVKHLKRLNYVKTPNYELIKASIKLAETKRGISSTTPLDWELGGLHENITNVTTKSIYRPPTKAADERREEEQADQNTKADVEDLDDNDYGNDEVASHVSGVSERDDTLQKLEDLK